MMLPFLYNNDKKKKQGASGFGTPVALGAPMLVSTGHDPLKSVVLLLVFNTFATVWGAVGTPLWYGFGGTSLGLTNDDLMEVSYKSAVAIAIGAFALVPWVLTILVPWRLIRPNLGFALASLSVSVLPSMGIAFVNYEFPSLVGG